MVAAAAEPPETPPLTPAAPDPRRLRARLRVQHRGADSARRRPREQRPAPRPPPRQSKAGKGRGGGGHGRERGSLAPTEREGELQLAIDSEIYRQGDSPFLQEFPVSGLRACSKFTVEASTQPSRFRGKVGRKGKKWTQACTRERRDSQPLSAPCTGKITTYPNGNSSARGGREGELGGGGARKGTGGIQQLISRQELEKNTAVMSRFSSTRARFLYKCNPLSISGTRSKP